MRSAWTWIIPGFALAASAAWSASASAQTISVHVVQVRASNEGGEFVDPLLAGLGEALRCPVWAGSCQDFELAARLGKSSYGAYLHEVASEGI